MKQHFSPLRSFLRLAPFVAAVGLLALPTWNGLGAGPDPGAAAAANKYIGANKCKNCHDAEASGHQYTIWKESSHAKAFETLKGEEAKKVAAAKGIADPTKADECLKCHVTGHGEDKGAFKKSFDPEEGVGCETCHGQGDDHQRARMRAAGESSDEGGAPAYTAPPAGEIGMDITEALCKKCHNEESPTYKPFCFHCRSFKIRHLNPLKPRTEAEKKALECGCDGKGKKCDHECAEAK
ncbi:MAG: cytochrome c family protein [Planctomycetes bacterium]|nr:cytochrome c family protein [Planctomycetota bacterium]